MSEILVHDLGVHQHPNKYIITTFIKGEFFCYLKLLNKELFEKGILKEEEHIGKIHIKNFLSIKHRRHSRLHYYPVDFDNNLYGYYYEVKNSTWLKEVLSKINKEQVAVQEKYKKPYRHFIIENNKYWIDVIGTEVVFTTEQSNEFLENLWS